MSKRFPIPDFDRDQFKNRVWSAPSLLPPPEQLRLKDAAKRGDAASFGAHAVTLSAATAAKFKFEGAHLHAVLCVLPHAPVRMVGRSWAWPIQRALVLDSLDASGAQVLADWTTPRPMNTRLGPDEGVMLKGGPVYVILGHRYGDHWIANRTLVANDAAAAGKGFSVLSATDDDNDDFHACNVSFTWA